ncbi:MAG TPA: hypothetical protein VMS19_05730 [Methyloceanibacter sp.]|nr:hypothetical protein [Methyloceanibacter sp.]
MTHEAFGDQRQGLRAKLADIGDGASDMSHAGLKEAMAWTAYQWIVLALLTAIFVLVTLSFGGIRTELAALKQERAGSGLDQTNMNAEIGKQMSDLKADVMRTLSELEGSIAKIGAKLDARGAPPKAAPAPKPAAKPKPQ